MMLVIYQSVMPKKGGWGLYSTIFLLHPFQHSGLFRNSPQKHKTDGITWFRVGEDQKKVYLSHECYPTLPIPSGLVPTLDQVAFSPMLKIVNIWSMQTSYSSQCSSCFGTTVDMVGSAGLC